MPIKGKAGLIFLCAATAHSFAIDARAAATTSTDWIEWKIPLADLTAAGVNIGAVRKMSIGVGSRTAPTPDGAGVIYVDDIRVTAAAAGE